MELTNEFRVGVPIEQAWEVLTDVERIAPCMPGAQLQEIEGDEYRGVVRIKVGPITAQYKGQATFVDQDEVNRVAVLRAEGRETRGQGNANATITATLVPDGEGTAVTVVTDLVVTGRVAQFGRGVLAEVSAKLLDQFVDCLEKTVLAEPTTPASSPADTAPAERPPVGPPATVMTEAEQTAPAKPAPTVAAAPQPTPRPAVRKIDSPEPAPVNLLDAAGSPVAKRVGPVLAVIAIVWLLKKLFGRSK
ncbi:MAG: SRPBCC domain-containing protein [Acidimicrobiales bacterium]